VGVRSNRYYCRLQQTVVLGVARLTSMTICPIHLCAELQFEAKAFKSPYERQPQSFRYKVRQSRLSIGQILIAHESEYDDMYVATVRASLGVSEAEPYEQ
jgi:hypothetical protein